MPVLGRLAVLTCFTLLHVHTSSSDSGRLFTAVFFPICDQEGLAKDLYKPLLYQKKNTKVFAKFLSNSCLIGVKPRSIETSEPIVVDNTDNTDNTD